MVRVSQIRYLTALSKVINHHRVVEKSLKLPLNQTLLLLGEVPTDTTLPLPNDVTVPTKKSEEV